MNIGTKLIVPALLLAGLGGATAAPAAANRLALQEPTSRQFSFGDRSGERAATCRGLPAEVAYPGEDFVGTAGNDVIVVVGPNAKVWGNLGNDTICVHGDPGYPDHGSRISGGPGHDVIITYSGSNLVLGDAGNDVLLSNAHVDDLEGGDDHDVIHAGGATAANIWGGNGNDFIHGSPGADQIFGNDGDDLVYGWGGNDTLYGDSGDDSLHGGAGWDGHAGGIGTDECTDSNSPVDGGMFGDCEAVVQTPAGPGGLAFG